MKLRKITMEGLGGLSGRWEVDFTAPEYQCGAFGVVGGAAPEREAISCAISQALGAAAPAEKAAGCKAEVVFASRGHVWKSQFSEAKSRASGAGDAGLRLFRRRQDESWEEVASGGAACRGALRQLCGLDPEAFSASSFIDQAKFLEFLRTGAEGRRSILEERARPTGCREISRRVHAETRGRRLKLEKLEAREAAVALLDDEALAALRSRAADLKQQVDNARKKAESAALELSAVKKREDLKRQEEEARAALEKMLEQDRRFGETRERLERAKQASVFSPAIEEIRRLTEAIATLGAELLEAEHATKESALVLESSRQKSLAARAEYDAAAEASRELAQMAPDIEAIDRRVAERKQASAHAEQALGSAQKALEARASELESLRKTEKALEDARAVTEAKLEKTEKDAALAAGLSGLCERAAQLEAAREALSGADQAVKLALSRASGESAALKDAERRTARAREALELARNAVLSAQARLEEIRGGKDPASQLAAMASLERQAALVKALAGARAAIARSEADEAKAKAKLTEVEKASREGDQKALQAKKSGIEMTAAFSRTAGEKAERLRALRFDEIPRAASAKAAALAAFAKLCAEDKALSKHFEEEGQARLERVIADEKSALLAWGRKLEGEAQRLQEARKAVCGAQAGLEARLSEQQASSAAEAAALQALEALRAAAAEKAGEVRSLEEAWSQAVSPFGFAGSQLAPSRVAGLLEERRAARAAALIERDLNEKAQAVQRALLARAEAEWQAAQALLGSARAVLSEARRGLALETEARAALFGDRSLAEERKRAALRLEKAAAERDAAGQKVREAQSACAQSEAVAARIRSRIESLAAEKDASEGRLDAALSEVFESREDLMLARRNAEAVAGWEKEEAAIKAGVRWARERLSEAKENLARHLAKCPSEAGLGEARAASDDAERRRAEAIRELSLAEHELERDAGARARRDEARREAAAARADLARWEALDERIGSEDGARFASYALGLVFRRLLGLASEELVALTGSLALAAAEGEAFGFAVVDNARNCALRRPGDLSCAEAGAVSLALAAGFARMRFEECGEGREARDVVWLNAAPGLLRGDEAQPLLRRAISRLRAQGLRVAVLADCRAETAGLSASIEVKGEASPGGASVSGPGVTGAP